MERVGGATTDSEFDLWSRIINEKAVISFYFAVPIFFTPSIIERCLWNCCRCRRIVSDNFFVR